LCAVIVLALTNLAASNPPSVAADQPSPPEPSPLNNCDWYGSLKSTSRGYYYDNVYDTTNKSYSSVEFHSVSSNGRYCAAEWSVDLETNYHDADGEVHYYQTLCARDHGSGYTSFGVQQDGPSAYHLNAFTYADTRYSTYRRFDPAPCDGAASGSVLVENFAGVGAVSCNPPATYTTVPNPDAQAFVGECFTSSRQDTADGGSASSELFEFRMRKTICDPTVDTDSDGLSDCREYDLRTFTNDPDTDGDGRSDGDEIVRGSDPLVPDADPDIDADGVPDLEDAFPGNPTEWADTDGDGIGDNADLDDNNDGIPDEEQSGTPPERWIVGLGDSFQSGEGTYDYDPSTDKSGNFCHRSPKAYPVKAASLLGGPWRAKLMSCSGAIASDVLKDTKYGEAPQLAQLEAFLGSGKRVDVITLGIGGNDVGFAKIVEGCATPLTGSCVDKFESPSYDGHVADLDHAIVKVRAVYDRLQALTAGSATTVVVVGYPVFMGTPKNLGDDCEGVFGAREVLWMHYKTLEFNRMLAAEARSHGFRYVGLDDAYKGHVLCEGDSDQWVNDFDPEGLGGGGVAQGLLEAESFHPKVAGHAATATLVAACIRDAASCPAPSSESGPPATELADDPWIDMTVLSNAMSGAIKAGTPGTGNYDFTLHSEPRYIGSVTSNADGSATFRFDIPADVPPGQHTLDVCRDGDGRQALRLCSSVSVKVSSPESRFTALVPARVLETRAGLSTVDGGAAGIGARGAGSVTEVVVAGRAGVPADASAAVLNVTVTGPDAPGYVTVYPCGTAPPTASNLNYVAGLTVPNAVITKIGTGGKICIFTQAATDLVVDVDGYFR